MAEDLDALLGVGFTAGLTKAVEEEKAEKGEKGETEVLPLPVAPISVEEMKDHVITNTADIVSKANETLSTILQDLKQIPTDADAVSSTAEFMNSYTALLRQFQKTNEMYEKMKHEKEMLAMKLMADKTMNDDNNETALTMTREEILARMKEKTVE